jgi:hypothetical protein
MAARNNPAGIRSLVYGVGKDKGGIEGLSVSAPTFGPTGDSPHYSDFASIGLVFYGTGSPPID